MGQPRTGKRAGRHTVLTPDRRILLVEGMRAGLTKELCAMRASIGLSTLMEWLARGRTDREEGYIPHTFDVKSKQWVHTKGRKVSAFAEFVDAMEKAEAGRLAEALLLIRAAAKGGEQVATEEVTTTAPDGTVTKTRKTRLTQPDWKAAAWTAEKTRPRDYGVMVRTELTGAEGGPVQVVTSLLDLINKGAADEEAEMAAQEKAK